MQHEEQPASLSPEFQSLGQRLRWHRLHQGLSQEALAEAIGASTRSIRRWERDLAIPQEIMRTRLCHLFGIDSSSLLRSAFSTESPGHTASLWHMPYARNPFFTGHDNLLEALHADLEADRASPGIRSAVLYGMAGIGKTQIAVEYAYRHALTYQAILWLAAETADTRLASLQQIAQILTLPEGQQEDQTWLLGAVVRWLATHEDWLLIADDAEDLESLQAMLPAGAQGAVLVTTRHQALGLLAPGYEVPPLPEEEGIALLLGRARRHHSSSLGERAAAIEVVRSLEGLPLALDQAGAYLDETGCSVTAYHDLLLQSRKQVLARRGNAPGGHPASVSATISLAIQQAERRHPAAGEVLQMCAFLHPELIPEELLAADMASLQPLLASALAEPFERDQILAALRAASLLTRHPETRTLSLHRLVQAVVRDQMDAPTTQHWSQWAVETVNAAFPQEKASWATCERYLLHALECVPLIEQGAGHLPAAVDLLFKAGSYLLERWRWRDAAPYLRQAVSRCEQQRGPDDPALVPLLVRWAVLSQLHGPSLETEQVVQRALHLAKLHLGANHPHTATALNALGANLRIQGKIHEAESVFRRALAIREHQGGATPHENASALNDLAIALCDRGKYREALPLLQRALSIWEQQEGPEHPHTGLGLNNLGMVYRHLGQHEQAIVVLRRALAIQEQQVGAEHWYLGYTLNHLASVCQSLGQHQEALTYGTRALRSREEQLGATHSLVATSLVTLASISQARGKQAKAESLLQRALEIWEQALGPEHPDLAEALTGLANLAMCQGQYTQAGQYSQRALSLQKQTLGAEHPKTAYTLANLAHLSHLQGRPEQAEPLYQRALAVLEQHLGSEHPWTRQVRSNYQALIRESAERTI